MHYVYIIQSLKDQSFYKGYSLDPQKRLIYHNLGRSRYTSSKTPWKLVAIFEFDTKSEALIKERKLKKYPRKSLVALIQSNRNLLNESKANR